MYHKKRLAGLEGRKQSTESNVLLHLAYTRDFAFPVPDIGTIQGNAGQLARKVFLRNYTLRYLPLPFQSHIQPCTDNTSTRSPGGWLSVERHVTNRRGSYL